VCLLVCVYAMDSYIADTTATLTTAAGGGGQGGVSVTKSLLGNSHYLTLSKAFSS